MKGAVAGVDGAGGIEGFDGLVALSVDLSINRAASEEPDILIPKS